MEAFPCPPFSCCSYFFLERAPADVPIPSAAACWTPSHCQQISKDVHSRTGSCPRDVISLGLLCHPTLHYTWSVGTVTHWEQRAEPRDNPKPAERERAALLGPFPDAAYWLLTRWHEKDSEKSIWSAKASLSPAAISRSLLHHTSRAVCPPQRGDGHASHTCVNAHYLHA